MGGPWGTVLGKRFLSAQLGQHQWHCTPVPPEEPRFGFWVQGNTMGDGDYSGIRWFQAPDEGLCNP